MVRFFLRVLKTISVENLGKDVKNNLGKDLLKTLKSILVENLGKDVKNNLGRDFRKILKINLVRVLVRIKYSW